MNKKTENTPLHSLLKVAKPSRRKRRSAEGKKDTANLEHLLKVQRMAKSLIEQNVLKVFPEEYRAIFPWLIWKDQTNAYKSNFIKNIALYLLSLNSPNPNAKMEAELYSTELDLLASFKDNVVTIHI